MLGEKCNDYNKKLAKHNKYKADGVESAPRKEELERGNIKPSVGGKKRDTNVMARH